MDIAQKVKVLFDTMATKPEYAVIIALSIVALTVMFYYLNKFLIDNNSGQVVIVFVLVMVIAGGIILFNDNILNALYILIPSILVLLTVALYSTEIKRVIWTRKNMKMVDVKYAEGRFINDDKIKSCINEIIKALQDMSKNDVGAIIVLSNDNVPSQIVESGVTLDSDISSELIESVFFPKTPLHDGAMVINGTKIVAAGCFLPLTQKDNIPKELGTRHRAGIGITETIDVVSIIVSEESGIISIARAGKIVRYADVELLKRTLGNYYWKELESSKK